MRIRRDGWHFILLMALTSGLCFESVFAQTEPPSSTDYRPVKPSPETVIREGDRITLWIQRDQTLSNEYDVDGQGNIELPHIGVVPVANSSVAHLEEVLERRLASILRKPLVEVVSIVRSEKIIEQEGYDIFLLGNVPRPGAYPLTQPENILQFMARTGGYLEQPKRDIQGSVVLVEANMERVTLLRKSGESFIVNLAKMLQTGDQTENHELEPGDVVYVPGGSFDYIEVLGEVGSPGKYYVPREETIFESLARAGGLTDYAGYRNIRIVRTKSETPKSLRVNLISILEQGDEKVIPMVQAGDAIYVPKSLFYHWKNFVTVLSDFDLSSRSVENVRAINGSSVGQISK